MLRQQTEEERHNFARVLADVRMTSHSTIKQLRHELAGLQRDQASMAEYVKKAVDAVQHKLTLQAASHKAQIADYVRDKERLTLENSYCRERLRQTEDRVTRSSREQRDVMITL